MSSLRFKISKGLDIPITGQPEMAVGTVSTPRHVALVGADYVGMKPTMKVEEGDTVKKGTVLFEDKKSPGVFFTSPVAGKVKAINRGAKRVFQSLVIEREGDAVESFDRPDKAPEALERSEVCRALQATGLWTALRTRPFSRTPAVEDSCDAVFVNAMDTNPLAARPGVVLAGRADDFRAGLRAVSKLTEGKAYLCFRPGDDVPGWDLPEVVNAQFEGPHPSGLVGTHIHFLEPASNKRTVWHLNYQDVIAIGAFFLRGELDTDRVLSLAGPGAKTPRLVKAPLGSSLTELADGETTDSEFGTRLVSGSVLCGRAPETDEELERTQFLGRYHLQLSLVPEGGERRLVGWHMPGSDQYSSKNIFVSAIPRAISRLMGQLPEAIRPPKVPDEPQFSFTTGTQGSPRAMVPIGAFESVMPLDILPTFLLRALITRDTEQAQALGALELDEEDLGLCNFVCPGKTEYSSLLRENLDIIERDG